MSSSPTFLSYPTDDHKGFSHLKHDRWMVKVSQAVALAMIRAAAEEAGDDIQDWMDVGLYNKFAYRVAADHVAETWVYNHDGTYYLLGRTPAR